MPDRSRSDNKDERFSCSLRTKAIYERGCTSSTEIPRKIAGSFLAFAFFALALGDHCPQLPRARVDLRQLVEISGVRAARDLQLLERLGRTAAQEVALGHRLVFERRIGF